MSRQTDLPSIRIVQTHKRDWTEVALKAAPFVIAGLFLVSIVDAIFIGPAASARMLMFETRLDRIEKYNRIGGVGYAYNR